MRFVAGFSLLVAAVSALPALPRAQQQVCDNPGRFVSVVIDASGSQADNDPNNVRLKGAQQIIASLTPEGSATAANKADEIAVVSFTTSADVLYPLGNPGSEASDVAASVSANGGTDVYLGLKAGLDQIARVGSSQLDRAGVVMFTDGLEDGVVGATEWERKRQRLQVVAKAKAAGVRVSWGHLSFPKTSTHGGGLLSDIWNIIFGGGVGRTTTTIAGPELDKELAAAVLATGGTVSVISSADAQISFVEQVLKNGITNNDGRCHGLDIDQSGGPVKNNVTSLGLCSDNANAVFTYTPSHSKEKLAVTIDLLSTANHVNLHATLENKFTGSKLKVTVDSASPTQILTAEAAPGENVEITLQPSGASADTCQYGVRLDTVPIDTIPTSWQTVSSSSSNAPLPSSSHDSSPTSSSTPPTSPDAHPSSSSNSPPPTSSNNSSSTSSSAFPTSDGPPSTSSKAPPPTSSNTHSSSTSQAPPPTSSAPPISSVPPPSSSTATSSTQQSSNSSASPTSISAAPTSQGPRPTSTPECPTAAIPSVTVTATATVVQTMTATTTATATATSVQTVTATASTTGSICLCKCDAPGVQPLAKIEL